MKIYRHVFAAVFVIYGLFTLNVCWAQRELPDFTELVEKQGAAVVNISTTQAVKRQNILQMPQIDESWRQDLSLLFTRCR